MSPATQYIQAMTARDKWTVQLTCPNCKNSGEADLWQEDGWSFSNGDQTTHISSVSDGFQATLTQKGAIEFSCSRCHVPANAKSS